MSKRFQILSLSGGGFLGLYTVTVIAELEKELGHPIARCFDLIAGTSVGGIIALGLSKEIPATEIKSAFERHGPLIFSSRPAPSGALASMFDLARFAAKPKYDGKQLRKTVEEIVGPKALIRDLSHRTIIPTVNVTKGQVQVFKTSHHPSFSRDLKLRLVDVAMATSAAPTYFPLAEIDDSLFVDGGLYANAPDLIALHEAQHFLEVDLEDVHILSIPKGCDIEFRLANTGSLPFGATVTWTVRNEGREAENKNDLGHRVGAGLVAFETSAYRGTHYMDCTVKVGGKVVAMRRVPVEISGVDAPRRNPVNRPAWTRFRR